SPAENTLHPCRTNTQLFVTSGTKCVPSISKRRKLYVPVARSEYLAALARYMAPWVGWLGPSRQSAAIDSSPCTNGGGADTPGASGSENRSTVLGTVTLGPVGVERWGRSIRPALPTTISRGVTSSVACTAAPKLLRR